MSEAHHFYQAIGELFATLVTADDDTEFLEIQQGQYRDFVPLKAVKRYQDKYLGQQVYWRVYPQFSQQGLSFKIVSFAEQSKQGHGQFILQGDWLESGQLQIWRNAGAVRINKHNWRSRLLPVSWENPPLPDAAFWQLQAKLVDGVFKVVTAQGPFPHPPRLEIKFNTLPQVKQVNGRCHFQVDCDGRVFQVTMKQKQWSKLETANSAYAQWVAALSGKLGAATSDGFVEEPNIQVFERSAKQEQAEGADAGTQVQSSATESSLSATQAEVVSEPGSPEVKTQTLEVTTTGGMTKYV